MTALTSPRMKSAPVALQLYFGVNGKEITSKTSKERRMGLKPIPGYVVQELAPLGGEILMPETWHYRGGMTKNGFMFILSKEKNDDGSYETGFRIQGITSVRERSGLIPSKACIRAREKFEKAATRVVRKCAEEMVGLFEKICLETIQNNSKSPKDSFHVAYSFFWNDELDMMIITTFGAPASTWLEARKIYHVMEKFKLLDMRKVSMDGE